MNGIQIISGTNAAEVGKLAAAFMIDIINDKPNAVLGLATGSTPIPLYQSLIEANQAKKVSFRGVRTVNLDEYVGLPGTHDQSYRYFMNTNLFDHVDIDKANTNVPDGMAGDAEAACNAYEEKIASLGGIDVQLLGIGLNGHIGFNEPTNVFPKRTHIVELTSSTREANKRFFASIDDVPTQAITMGIGTIMAAKKIMMIATGENKAEILKASLTGEVNPMVPASILQFHPDVTVFADEAALRLL